MNEMTARCLFLPMQCSQPIGQLIRRRSSNIQRTLHTLLELSENGLQERYYDTAVNLMQGIAYIYQIDAEVRDQPECIEE